MSAPTVPAVPIEGELAAMAWVEGPHRTEGGSAAAWGEGEGQGGAGRMEAGAGKGADEGDGPDACGGEW